MRTGKGWGKYPNIKKELNPSMEDNGIFWVTKKEFFKHFPAIYLCKLNMSKLRDPKYANDLEDEFERREKPKPKPKAKPKPVPQAAPEQEELVPIIIDKTSIHPKYKIVAQDYNGAVTFSKMNKDLVKGVSIAKGVEEFKKNPEKYLAIHYQSSICDMGWPQEVHNFTYVYRQGTEDTEIEGVTPGGKRTILMNVLR